MTKSSMSRVPIPRHREGEHYLGGAIPIEWLEQASRLGGKALNVGIMIWHHAVMAKSGQVAISLTTVGQRMGFDRTTGTRALRRLEEHGLISVERGPGRSPVVRLHWPARGSSRDCVTAGKND